VSGQTEPKLFISNGGVISVQALNGFASVASRKLGMSYSDIREALGPIQEVCIIQPLTLEAYELGLEIAERYSYSLYDSMIVMRCPAIRMYSSVLGSYATWSKN